MFKEKYITGDYLAKNPTCGAEHSSWKANNILKMINKNNLTPNTICEIGCGFGEILRTLQQRMDDKCIFWGYDISPQAIDICNSKANEKLIFNLQDIMEEKQVYFDLILLIDVIEHLEDYFNFLSEIKGKSQYKIFHIPLDLSINSVLRPWTLINTRKVFGHIHYFTKDIAIQVLEDMDYEILDWFYTVHPFEFLRKSVKSYIMKALQKSLYAINMDFAVRLLGGCSLMILTR